jgi:hypothetical protein
MRSPASFEALREVWLYLWWEKWFRPAIETDAVAGKPGKRWLNILERLR